MVANLKHRHTIAGTRANALLTGVLAGYRRAVVFWVVSAFWVLIIAGTGSVHGQTLRYHMHREVAVPEYAFLRIGPFYSDIRLSQSAGFRHTRSSGAGTDYLYGQRRGRIREDGAEWPLITTLDFRNYLLLSRNADIDLSVRVRYQHYPLGTEEDLFLVTLPEEGIEGTLSAAFRLTPYIRGTIYDNFVWRTDYVDSRGLIDELSGRQYEYIRNVFGVDTDWMPAPDKNVSLALSRSDYWPQSREFRNQKRVTHRQELSYSQQYRTYVSAGIRARFTQTDYAARERTDYDEQLYSLFTDLSLTRHVSAGAWFGYSIVTLDSAADDAATGREGVNWGASLNAEEGFWVWIPQLTHQADVSRTVEEGFDTTYQTVDRYRYRMGWQGDALHAGLTVDYRDVDPGSRYVSSYTDTRYQADASYPLTSFARLRGATGYTLRRNRRPDRRADDQALPLDRGTDYETFFWRLGTHFDVTRRIVFDTWYQHNERFSDRKDMEFTRDTFQAMLTFSHQF